VTEPLPLFPLSTVLVPGEVLPLHVFEPRYRDLVHDLTGADGGGAAGAQFGVIGIRQGHEVGAGQLGGLYDVGCSAEILRTEPHDDGSWDLVTMGRHRFRLDAVVEDSGKDYLVGQVDWLEEPSHTVPDDLVHEVRTRFIQYCDQLGIDREAAAQPSGVLEDPTLLSYVITGTMLLHLPERQRLLAARDAQARLLRADALLRRERVLWQVVPSVPALHLAQLRPDPR
jgi:uncharacterized protein